MPQTSNNYTSRNDLNSIRNRNSNYDSNLAYTDEQIQLVYHIKNCKDYYEILGVRMDANVNQIKRAYKQLALLLHPDKNKAPGAIEAFTIVGNAFAVLSDLESRRNYNIQISNPIIIQPNGSNSRGEGLYNRFFGSRQHRAFNRMYQRQRYVKLLYFVAGIILAILLFLSLTSTFLPSPSYSLIKTEKYNILRTTRPLRVKYYVKDKFDENQKMVKRTDKIIEQEYVITLKENCYNENVKKAEKMMYAKASGNELEFSKAKAIKTPSCDLLDEMGLN